MKNSEKSDRFEKLGEIELLTPWERQKILEEFNASEASYQKDKTLHRLFEEKAALMPGRTAIVHGRERLSYGELNKKANQLAHILREKGVKPDTIVPLIAERSIEMVIAVFAILKAGGAYLPIDPEYPEERIRYMQKDSRARILLMQSRLRHKFSFDEEIVYFDDARFYVREGENLQSESGPESLAYVQYTSGSTGRPKGVMVEHRSVVNVLEALEKAYPMKAGDVYLLKTNYTFDVSVAELFGWFMGEGRLAILEKGKEKDPRAIIKAIGGYGITHINFVSSMLKPFLDAIREEDIGTLDCLKYVLAAGEVLPAHLAAQFYRLIDGVRLENLYGPTEATVYATAYSVTKKEYSDRIPIGKPLQNMKVYILTPNQRLQPIGIPGELYLSGEGLARGYLNEPKLTAEKFIPNPYKVGTRLYKTGDLARWLPDGNIEFLGRTDEQVKVGGIRIEPGEIEKQLLRHPFIKGACVTAKEKNGGKYLYAYLVSDEKVIAAEMRQYLAKELPDYMIPLEFIQILEIPLTSGGKIDKKALPEPQFKIKEKYEAPRNEIEEKLTAIWTEILGGKKVGIRDNFIEIGGSSIAVLKAAYQIEKNYQIRFPTTEIFQSPTIEAVAESIHKKLLLKNVHGVIKLNRSSSPKKLFILYGMDSDICGYKNLAKYLEKECTVYAIHSKGLLPQNVFLSGRRTLLHHCMAEIKRIQPQGPYNLMGHGIGTRLACELARMLEKQKDQVEKLILLDIYDLFPINYLKYLFTKAKHIWQRGLHAPLYIIKAQESEHPWLKEEDWKKIIGNGGSFYKAPGTHESILLYPYIEKLGRICQDILKT